MREDRGIVNTVFCLYRKKRVIVNKSSCIYRKTGVFLTYGSYRIKSVKTTFAIQFHLNNIMPVFGFILLIEVDTFIWLNDRNIEYIIDIYKKENDNWQAWKHNRKSRRKRTTDRHESITGSIEGKGQLTDIIFIVSNLCWKTSTYTVYMDSLIFRNRRYCSYSEITMEAGTFSAYSSIGIQWEN
jgi:hypothetical protein